MNNNHKRVLKKFSVRSVLLLVLLFAMGSSFGQNLSGIPGLALWLRADSGVVNVGDSVALWHDQSGNGYDAIAVPDSEPTLISASTINNMPSIKFNGTSDYFTGPQIAAFNNQTGGCTYIFMVCKGNTPQTTGSPGLFTIGSQSYGLLWERNSGGLGDLFVSYQYGNPGGDYVYSTSAIPVNGAAFPYKILEVRKMEGQSVGLYANCASATTGGGTNSSLVGTFIDSIYNIGHGYGTTTFLNGEIAELIVFTGNPCLNGAQIAQVETYLGTKYSPTVHIGPRDTTITHGLCALPLTVPTGFTNYLWSTGAITNSISVSTSGTYSVKFTDSFGATQYDTTTVTSPVITLNPTATLCSGDSLELVPNVPSFTNYTFKWNPGNQTTDSIKIGATGTYKVVVTDALNTSCSVTTNAEVVTVDNFRNSLSLGSAATLCSGNKLSLVTPVEPWNRLQFVWSTGSTDSLIWINTPATYSVTVTDTIGCSGNASINVTIAGVAPHVNFTTNPVCPGLAYAPYNNSDSVHVKYVWQFGDGGTDTSRFPSYLYHAAGTFQVELTVTNTVTGCVNDTVIPVVVNALPGAAFQSAIACTGYLYNFIDLSVPAPGQSISTYSWNLGDINHPLTDTSSSQNPYYTYSVIDTNVVTLTVTQANGCQATTSGTIIVESPFSVPATPVLQFPEDSSISASNVITFGWQTTEGAEYYDLTVSTDPNLAIGDSIYYNIFSNQTTVTLPPNQLYYWHVAAVNPCGNTTPSQTNNFTLFNPADLGNLAFWLRADVGVVASNDSVGEWMDQSGNGNNAGANGPARPTVKPQVPLLNYMPSVYFNGSSDVMTGNQIHPLDNGTSFSIFIVARADAAQPVLPGGCAEPAGIFTIGSDLNTGMWIERNPYSGFAFINNYNSDFYNLITPVLLTDLQAMPDAACPYHAYGVVKDVNVFSRIDINGVFDVSSYNPDEYAAFTNDVYSLGHIPGADPYGCPVGIPYGYLNGEIAEIIVYNTQLNPQQSQQVYSYLFNKYAPPVNLGPDIVQNYSLCPVTLKTGNRFVSYLWSTGATSDSLNVTQSGKYSVTVQDVFNHISSDSINVTLPYQGSNPDTDFVCHGDTGQIMQLINQPQSYTYAWYYEATLTSTPNNLHINSDVIYPYLGGYYYTVISDTGHCSITTQKIPLIIDNFYTAQLLPAYDTICRNGTLEINPTTYVIDSFLWQPLNDTASAPYIPNSGTYYLYTSDNHNCKNFDSTNITTHALAPSTNFSVPNYCLSNTTYFIDSSVADTGDFITSYYWNYGGGIPATDTTVNGQTSYTLDYGYGNYTVTLKVTTDSGCVGIKTEHITILPSPNVGYTDSANNSVYPYILCAGSSSSAQFTDTSDAVGGSAITERIWKFNGVVNPDSGPTIQYSFPQQGVYTVTLEVVNALGCADSVSEQIDVNPPFTAAFSYTDHCLGDTTTFTDLTQSLSVVSRTWNFHESSGGPYAYSQTAQIVFGQTGTYDVELQLENAIGCVSTVDKLVKIVEKPLADFTNLISCAGLPYMPMDSSFAYGDTLVEWNWNIGGHISHLPSPVVTFNTTGPQSVSLTVVSSEGCVDSVTQTIEVAPVPTALFAFNPLYGTAPLVVTFSNRSTGADSYLWDFGDGSSLPLNSPFINPPTPHTYSPNGDYNIVLYAYNQYGCYDSLSRLLTVIPTTLDIAIEQVSTFSAPQPDGSQLVTLTAYVSNVGTRIITSAQLYSTLGGSGIMEQNWTGYLLSGQTIYDSFPAQFVVPAGAGNTYVCVTATDVNNGETEVDTLNNQNCASLSGTMQLTGPQPNPAITNSLLGIILPQAGTVYVAIFDELGRVIVPETSYSLPVGRTDYTIPVSRLQGAEYYIRVRYNDDTEVRNFVVR